MRGSLAGRKGSYGADIWRSDTVDLSYTRQSWGVGGGRTFNLGTQPVAFGRLYGVRILNWFMDGQWEVVWCTVEIRNGWSKYIG